MYNNGTEEQKQVVSVIPKGMNVVFNFRSCPRLLSVTNFYTNTLEALETVATKILENHSNFLVDELQDFITNVAGDLILSDEVDKDYSFEVDNERIQIILQTESDDKKVLNIELNLRDMNILIKATMDENNLILDMFMNEKNINTIIRYIPNPSN